MPPTLRKILVHTSKVASSSLNRLDSSQRKRKKHETRILKDSERTITRQQSRQKKKQPKSKQPVDSSSSADESDAECLYCGYLYSESNEGWIMCMVCSKWAHCKCAGEDDDDPEAVHVCTLCQ
ncbi:hypothetical protein M8J76_006379 [Diaphorina citri]|nr:hypothetical protein M8J76_006379 [Diaphorina citri]